MLVKLYGSSSYLVLRVQSTSPAKCVNVCSPFSVKGPVSVYVNVSSMSWSVFASRGSHSKGIHCPLLQIHIRSEFAGTGDTCPSSLPVHVPVGWDGRACLWRKGMGV